VLGKRKPEHKGKGGEKRRSKGSDRRQVYSMDTEDYEESSDYHQEQEYKDWSVGCDHEVYAFQTGSTRPSFPPCTTHYCVDKNISHTYSFERYYKRQSPSRLVGNARFGSKGKGRGAFLFNSISGKGGKGGKGKSKGKAKGKGKGLGRDKGKGSKGKMSNGKDGR
jgi:hypothetical protein